MANNEVEGEKPVDVGRRIDNLEAAVFEIRDALLGLDPNANKKSMLDRNRAKGFAQSRLVERQFIKKRTINKTHTEGVVRGQLVDSNVSLRRGFRYYDSMPNFNGCDYFEYFLDWILDMEDFFKHMNIPEEEKCRYVLHKLTGPALWWWLRLQESREKQGKCCIRSWSRMRKLMEEEFLPWNYEQILDNKYRVNEQNINNHAKEFHGEHVVNHKPTLCQIQGINEDNQLLVKDKGEVVEEIISNQDADLVEEYVDDLNEVKEETFDSIESTPKTCDLIMQNRSQEELHGGIKQIKSEIVESRNHYFVHFNEIQQIDFIGVENFLVLSNPLVDVAKKLKMKANVICVELKRLKQSLYSKYLFQWEGRIQFSRLNSRASFFEVKETDVGQGPPINYGPCIYFY